MAKNRTKLRHKPSHQHSYGDAVNRLKRAHGHLSSVIKMLEEDRSCGDILQQLSAVISALGGTRVLILQSHLNSCLKPMLETKDGYLVKEIEQIIQRAMKV